MSNWLKWSVCVSLLVLGLFAVVGQATAQLNPYGLPQLGGAGLGAVNPYSPLGAGYGPYSMPGVNAYTPYGGGNQNQNNPYIYYSSQGGNGGIYGRAGGSLYGAAQVINAYGNALTSQEQSRIMREQYYQMQIETARKRFDLKRYIAANTPSYAEEMEKLNRLTVRRIQNNVAPAEVSSGKALNILVEDAGKFAGKRASTGTAEVPPDVLRQLNVTKRGNGVGVLRNDGKIDWPPSTADVLSPEQRKNISLLAQAVVRDAVRGKIDANVSKDLRRALEEAKEQCFRKVNDVPGDLYRDAKRFLGDLESSVRAVQEGEVAAQADFDNWVGGKARPVQDVVDFLVGKGLRFAPAAPGDEAAYRALHSALSNYDGALNAQYAAEPPKE